jgi:hypothetical protein
VRLTGPASPTTNLPSAFPRTFSRQIHYALPLARTPMTLERPIGIEDIGQLPLDPGNSKGFSLLKYPLPNDASSPFLICHSFPPTSL